MGTTFAPLSHLSDSQKLLGSSIITQILNNYTRILNNYAATAMLFQQYDFFYIFPSFISM